VGNSTTPGENQLCNWIPRELDEGTTETLHCYEDIVSDAKREMPTKSTAIRLYFFQVGRRVTVVMTGVDAVLSLCEVEVFTPATVAVGNCPGEEKSSAVLGDTCFDFEDEEATGYDSASEVCEDKDMTLLSDMDETASDFVVNRLKSEDSSKNVMVWIGAKRDRASTYNNEKWTWITGDSVDMDIPWGRGQPNNYNQEQDCAVMDSDKEWGWNDISCRISARVVCSSPPAKCVSPEVNAGSWYTGSSQAVTYHCPLGEMPEGQRERECKDGVWSPEEKPISCKEVDCGQVPGLADGEVHVLDGRTTWGARIRYKCKDGFAMTAGDEERTCEENGWSGRSPRCARARCSPLASVSGADVRRTPGDDGSNDGVGSRLTYSCRAGHVAEGDLSRECLLGGQWSGSPPRCRFVDCGQPPEVEDGSYNLIDGRTTFGAEAAYTCSADYRLTSEEDDRAKCGSNGRWIGPKAKCEIITCPQPRAPAGGRVSGYDRTVGKTIEFSCLTGHVLEGDSELKCGRDGDWSGLAPICRFVDCGALRQPPGGTVHYVNASTHLGSVARCVLIALLVTP